MHHSQFALAVAAALLFLAPANAEQSKTPPADNPACGLVDGTKAAALFGKGFDGYSPEADMEPSYGASSESECWLGFGGGGVTMGYPLRVVLSTYPTPDAAAAGVGASLSDYGGIKGATINTPPRNVGNADTARTVTLPEGLVLFVFAKGSNMIQLNVPQNSYEIMSLEAIIQVAEEAAAKAP